MRQGFYAPAARVSEYRRLNGRWQLIGYVGRDIAHIAYTDTNVPPYFGFTLANALRNHPAR
ncbi:MAG: hypothetical protein WKG07_26980 [Hymenobacter sp.]